TAFWPLLEEGAAPGTRSIAVNMFPLAGVSPMILLHRLRKEVDPWVRRGLVQCLSEFRSEAFLPGEREQVAKEFLHLFSTEPDSGSHSALEWLLRKWDYGKKVDAVIRDLRSAGPRKDV